MNKKNVKQSKGITLIALVVTVVVLLILAGISISLLTGEDGIIIKSQEAKIKSEKAAEKESIILALNAVEIDNAIKKSSKISAKNLKTELEKAGYAGVEVTGIEKLRVTMPSGNRYKVTQNGDITENNDIDILKKYLLGSNEQGINLKTIVNMEEAESLDELSFIGNEVIEDADRSLEILNFDTISLEEIYIPFMYNDELYVVYANTDLDTTRVEERENTLIFEGNKVLEPHIFVGDPIDIDVEIEDYNHRQYAVVIEMKGESIFKICYPMPYADPTYISHRGFFIEEEFYFTFLKKDNSYSIFSWGEDSSIYDEGEIVLKKIIDIGENDIVLEENNFMALRNHKTNTCGIYSTPDGNYEIPKTVGGIVVNEIMADGIKGIPTFTKPITINCYDHFAYLEEIKVTTSDLEFIWSSHKDKFNVKILDLTEAGDEIEIPQEYLGSTDIKIYVNQAVKEDYQEYGNIMIRN